MEARQIAGTEHVIFHKADVEEIINLQPIGKQAKAYQVFPAPAADRIYWS